MHPLLRTLLCATALALLPSLACAAADGDDAAASFYARNVGAWSIAGFVSDQGGTVACRVTRPTKTGSLFGYSTGIGDGEQGMEVFTLFSVPANAADDTPGTLLVAFDGQAPTVLGGHVKGGFLQVDLAEDRPLLEGMLDRFKTRRLLAFTVSFASAATPPEQVDLAGSAQALRENAACLSAMLHASMARMAQARAGGQPKAPIHAED